METILSEYGKYLKKQKLSDNTFASYMRDLDNFCSYIGKSDDEALTAADNGVLHSYIEKCAKRARLIPPLPVPLPPAAQILSLSVQEKIYQYRPDLRS